MVTRGAMIWSERKGGPTSLCKEISLKAAGGNEEVDRVRKFSPLLANKLAHTSVQMYCHPTCIFPITKFLYELESGLCRFPVSFQSWFLHFVQEGPPLFPGLRLAPFNSI